MRKPLWIVLHEPYPAARHLLGVFETMIEAKVFAQRNWWRWGERANAYIYGTLRKQGWRPEREKHPRKTSR